MSTAPSILLVEDETLLRTMVSEALEDLGYRVMPAADGRAALELLAGPEHIDILFSDITMPNGVSGVDVAEHAARLRPGVRVVLASGYAKGQLPPLPPGIEFLQKPYRVPQLVELFGAAPAG